MKDHGNKVSEVTMQRNLEPIGYKCYDKRESRQHILNVQISLK